MPPPLSEEEIQAFENLEREILAGARIKPIFVSGRSDLLAFLAARHPGAKRVTLEEEYASIDRVTARGVRRETGATLVRPAAEALLFGAEGYSEAALRALVLARAPTTLAAKLEHILKWAIRSLEAGAHLYPKPWDRLPFPRGLFPLTLDVQRELEAEGLIGAEDSRRLAEVRARGEVPAMGTDVPPPSRGIGTREWTAWHILKAFVLRTEAIRRGDTDEREHQLMTITSLFFERQQVERTEADVIVGRKSREGSAKARLAPRPPGKRARVAEWQAWAEVNTEPHWSGSRKAGAIARHFGEKPETVRRLIRAVPSKPGTNPRSSQNR